LASDARANGDRIRGAEGAIPRAARRQTSISEHLAKQEPRQGFRQGGSKTSRGLLSAGRASRAQLHSVPSSERFRKAALTMTIQDFMHGPAGASRQSMDASADEFVELREAALEDVHRRGAQRYRRAAYVTVSHPRLLPRCRPRSRVGQLLPTTMQHTFVLVCRLNQSVCRAEPAVAYDVTGCAHVRLSGSSTRLSVRGRYPDTSSVMSRSVRPRPSGNSLDASLVAGCYRSRLWPSLRREAALTMT
jgi:hypothetical protein